MIKTFVKTGDRVLVYQRPDSHQEFEGAGKVTKIYPQSDYESAFVEVLFDDDEEYGPLARWILPSHLEKSD